MIDPQVEQGGASSWFWIVENALGAAAGFVDATGEGESAEGAATGAAPSSSSRPLTPAWNGASGDRHLVASQRKL